MRVEDGTNFGADPGDVASPGDSFLVIVSRREPALLAQLARVFETNDRVQVILDRRAAAPAPPTSSPDRRQHDISASLRELGWAVVIGRAVPGRARPRRQPVESSA